jgi:hypothetical protein
MRVFLHLEGFGTRGLRCLRALGSASASIIIPLIQTSAVGREEYHDIDDVFRLADTLQGLIPSTNRALTRLFCRH